MCLRTRKLFNTLATMLALTVIVALPASAQAQDSLRSEINARPVAVTINPDAIRVNKRRPIPFKPFEMLDPATGKPISREGIITLDDGKKMTAGEYYDQLNRIELGLTALGYSLRNNTESRVALQTSAIDTATLNKQAEALRANVMPNTRFRAVDTKAFEEESKRLFKFNPKLIEIIGLPGPSPKSVQKSKNFNYSFGNTSTFAANINGQIDVNGNSNQTIIDGKVNAGGAMFGHSFNLLQITAKLDAQKTNPSTLNLNVQAGGNNLYNFSKTVNLSWSTSGSPSTSYNPSVTYNFSLGPIPMTAQFGLNAQVGLNYAVAIAPVKASAHLGLLAKGTVYAQVGAGISIVSAGVGVSLTLMDVTGNLDGKISIELDASNKPYFDWAYSNALNANILAGEAYVYATIKHPCITCWPPWKLVETTYDWTIFKYGGVQLNGYTFNDSGTLSLF